MLESWPRKESGGRMVVGDSNGHPQKAPAMLQVPTTGARECDLHVSSGQGQPVLLMRQKRSQGQGVHGSETQLPTMRSIGSTRRAPNGGNSMRPLEDQKEKGPWSRNK